MQEKYDTLVLPHQGPLRRRCRDRDAGREQGRADYDFTNFLRLARSSPSAQGPACRHEAYHQDRMKEPYSGMTLMDLRGPSEQGSTKRLSAAIGRGTVVGEILDSLRRFLRQGQARRRNSATPMPVTCMESKTADGTLSCGSIMSPECISRTRLSSSSRTALSSVNPMQPRGSGRTCACGSRRCGAGA